MSPIDTRRRLALMSAPAAALWLAGCGGSGSGSSGNASIRVLNLASDLPSIDLYADDAKPFGAVAADTPSSYTTLDADTYTLQVKRAGEGTTLLSGSWSLSKDSHYTAVVWGRETALRLATLPEDEDLDDIDSGNAKVRIFNATADSGSVDIYFTASTTDIGDAAPTQGSLGSATLSSWHDLSQGSWRLRVTGAGDPNDLRLDIPVVTLADKQYTTLVLTAGPSGVLVNATLVAQQGATSTQKNTKARVRLAASMSAAGNVAVSVGGRTVTGGLRSPSVGPYVLVDAGSPALTVRVDGTVITDEARSFSAGTDYTLLVYGAQGAGQVHVIQDDNRLPTTSGRVKVRLLHGIAGGEPMTMSVDYLALASEVSVGTASAFTATTSNGSVRVDVTTPSAASALFSTTEVNLQSLGVYTVFMLDGNEAPSGVIRKER